MFGDGAGMKKMSGLTEEISIMRYDQTETGEHRVRSSQGRAGHRKRKKMQLVPCFQGRQGKEIQERVRGKEEKASDISWPRAVFSDSLEACEAISL